MPGRADAAGRGLPGPLRLRLPATSANLGPGFDTLALALALYLEIDAAPSAAFSIEATGRNADICSRLEGNLLLSVYRDAMRVHGRGREAPPLALRMHNGIPLGMGCGSSAASRLAGVALAAHFGSLGWTGDEILAEAARLEGHPDNVAACWLGGFVASAWDTLPGLGAAQGSAKLYTARVAPPQQWQALLVLPDLPLATTASRGVLPESYSRAHAVVNLQRVALLTAAFASGRSELLRVGTGDLLHQPYRSEVCPLLPQLLPLAGQGVILSVTLSGAGPGVLLLIESGAAAAEEAAEQVWLLLGKPGDAGMPPASTGRLQDGSLWQVQGFEPLHCSLAVEGARIEAL